MTPQEGSERLDLPPPFKSSVVTSASPGKFSTASSPPTIQSAMPYSASSHSAESQLD